MNEEMTTVSPKRNGDKVELKVTGHEVYCGMPVTQFRFNNKDAKQYRSGWGLLSDHYLTKEEIIECCKEQGIDIYNMTREIWKDSTVWRSRLCSHIDAQLKEAKDKYDGKIVVTHTYKYIEDNVYLVTIKLNWGCGQWRKFYLPLEIDKKGYKEETGYSIKISEYIEEEIDTLLDPAYWDDDYKFKFVMNKEEWDDDETFSQIDHYVIDQQKRFKHMGYHL